MEIVMSWDDIMRRVLPPIGGVSPHITGPAGTYAAGSKEGRVPPSTIPHGGVDFNYVGGQSKLNKSYPTLRSPVTGVVTNAGEGSVGRIAIKDANGFSHEILHTHTQNVKVGDLVGFGQPIGTMGNTGVNPANPEKGDYHVHYQLKDRGGKVINPAEFWNQLDSVKDDPGDPAYLKEYDHYLRELDTHSDPDPLSRDSQAPFDDRFGNWGSAPASTAPSVAPDRPESFDNRFGNWGAAPAGRFGDTRSAVLRALEKYSGSAVPDGSASAPVQGASWGRPSSPPNSIGTGGVLGNYMDPSLIAPAQGALPAGLVSSGPIAPDLPSDEAAGSNPVRYVSGRIMGQPQASISNTGAQAVPPSPERSRPPVGIFSGQPMLPFPLPPSFWSRRDDTRAPDDDEEERSSRWLRLMSPQ
jgi:hypothetical protein